MAPTRTDELFTELETVLNEDTDIGHSIEALTDRLYAEFEANKNSPGRIQALVDAGRAKNAAMRAAVMRNTPAENPAPATLADSYPGPDGLAAFNTALAGYTGSRVTLDGVDAAAGTEPAKDYYSHSADGSVSTTGPTD